MKGLFNRGYAAALLVGAALFAAACGTAEAEGSSRAKSTFAEHTCDRTVVTQHESYTTYDHYALIDVGPDPTKVWLHATFRGSFMQSCPGEASCSGLLDSSAVVTSHRQPSTYANGMLLVQCGSVIEHDDGATTDYVSFEEFTIEVQP